MQLELKPLVALVMYGRGDSLSTDRQPWAGAGPVVVSLHRIRETKAGPILDAGRTLCRTEAQELGTVLSDPEREGAWHGDVLFPDGLLAGSLNSLTWFRWPKRVRQYWRTGHGQIAIEAVLPGLVFHVQDLVLRVAAFTGKARPCATTALFHAPLGNVYDDTRVCTGGASLPRRMGPESMQQWEWVMDGTNYQHVNHAGTLLGGATTDELIAFWQRRERYRTPPAKALAPLGLTLSEWLRRARQRTA